MAPKLPSSMKYSCSYVSLKKNTRGSLETHLHTHGDNGEWSNVHSVHVSCKTMIKYMVYKLFYFET